jgi:hypothetical protein
MDSPAYQRRLHTHVGWLEQQKCAWHNLIDWKPRRGMGLLACMRLDGAASLGSAVGSDYTTQ